MVALSSWVMRPRPISSWVTRGLLTLVIAFWTWFSLASGIGEMGGLGIMALLMHLILPLALIALLVVCWRWELVGGVLLVLAAVAMTFFFHHLEKFQFVLFILEIPVALMGVLLIYNSRDKTTSQKSKTQPTAKLG